ncbi:diacylglycerol/lipid kinase family protein [Demequina globuliformis]|uniref:diacylglycerol/lipid kinase family protein n=1 Tax=Demequina globuliformis TaxID=676202 RepID=UPI0007857F7A|nr:diacylglycerol kinase family protein [Demequina globuliformis]
MSAEYLGIVWNPSKTSKDDLAAALEDALDGAAPPRVSWFETTVEDPGRGQARSALAAGVDVVIAAGGDGTVRAVAEVLAEADRPVSLAIVPMGTGNLLARNLEVPLPAAEALGIALSGHERSVDLAWAHTHIDGDDVRLAFTVMAGMGIDAHMITETDEDLKGKVGWLAYVESLGRAVAASDVVDLQVVTDGGQPESERAHTIIVGNCGILTGGVVLLPDADPADGELDMLILSADGVGGWLDTLRSMVWDNGLKRVVGATDEAESSASVDHRRVRSVSVELSEPRVLELDGDDVGECVRVEFSVQPEALRVRSPQQ